MLLQLTEYIQQKTPEYIIWLSADLLHTGISETYVQILKAVSIA